MGAAMKTMGAAKFKAECLGLMDEVETKRTTVTITKNGREVARLMPMPASKKTDPLDYFFIGGKILGDIESPVVPLSDYEALK